MVLGPAAAAEPPQPEYEVRGTLTQLSFLAAATPYRELVGRFEVSVLGCHWHIRYTPIVSKTLGIADQVVEDYKVAAYDGTNVYQLTSHELAVRNHAILRDGKLIQPQNVSPAAIQSGPAPQALDLRLEILWLAFASHCYFQSLSNGWILPIFSTFHDLEMYQKDYLVRGTWQVLPRPPGLPRLLILSDAYRYQGDAAHTPLTPTAHYSVLSVTNAGSLTFPQVCQVTNYGTPGKVIAVTELLVDQVHSASSIREFCPPISERAHIRDDRFLTGMVPMRFSYDASNWLSREAAEKHYRTHLARSQAQAKSLQKQKPKTGKVLVLTVFLCALFLFPAYVILVRRRRQQHSIGEDNKT